MGQKRRDPTDTENDAYALVDDRAERRHRQRTQDELDRHGELAPPWVKFPMKAGRMGWRMGAGESWMMTWSRYMADQTEADRLRYLRRHPAPWDWHRVISARVWPSTASARPTSEQRDQRRASLIAMGALRQDIGYDLWLAHVGDPPGRGPWRGPADTPYSLLRTRARSLAFWARWGQAQTARQREQWLADHPAPASLHAVAVAFRTRRAAAHPVSSDDLVVELAATGTLAPPWAHGVMEPQAKSGIGGVPFREDAPIDSMWAWWAAAAFDDAPTWWRYLARWPSPPDPWSLFLAKWFASLHDPRFRAPAP